MSRFNIALPFLVVALTSAPVTFAKDLTATRTFTKSDGDKVVDTTTFNTKKDSVNIKSTTTRTDGETKTVDTKTVPDKTGGFTVTKSVTGFDGKNHTSKSHVGGSKKA